MTRVRINWDEWYPVYFIESGRFVYGEEYEMSEEDIAFVRKASENFHDAQEILKNLVHPTERF